MRLTCRTSGFTIVEILVVVALMSMLILGVSQLSLMAAKSEKHASQSTDFTALRSIIISQLYAIKGSDCPSIFTPVPAVGAPPLPAPPANLVTPTDVTIPLNARKVPLTVRSSATGPGWLIDSKGIYLNGAYYQLYLDTTSPPLGSSSPTPNTACFGDNSVSCVGFLKLSRFRSNASPGMPQIGLNEYSQIIGGLRFNVIGGAVANCGPGAAAFPLGCVAATAPTPAPPTVPVGTQGGQYTCDPGFYLSRLLTLDRGQTANVRPDGSLTVLNDNFIYGAECCPLPTF